MESGLGLLYAMFHEFIIFSQFSAVHNFLYYSALYLILNYSELAASHFDKVIKPPGLPRPMLLLPNLIKPLKPSYSNPDLMNVKPTFAKCLRASLLKEKALIKQPSWRTGWIFCVIHKISSREWLPSWSWWYKLIFLLWKLYHTASNEITLSQVEISIPFMHNFPFAIIKSFVLSRTKKRGLERNTREEFHWCFEYFCTENHSKTYCVSYAFGDII